MAKKMTLDKLATMVERGFEGTDKRLDKVDERLERIEKRMVRLDATIFLDHKRRI